MNPEHCGKCRRRGGISLRAAQEVQKRELLRMKRLSLIGFYRYWVALTYLSVAAAVSGAFLAAQGHIGAAMLCLICSGICDMFDGTVARAAKRSPMEKGYGIQIDSLADVISFGVCPAMIGYALCLRDAQGSVAALAVTAMVMAAYVLAALIRLAYFNVTEEEIQDRQEKRTHYEGLPVTSAAMILPVVYVLICNLVGAYWIYNAVLLLMAAAFVLKVRIPKLKLRQIGVLSAVGLAIILLTMVLRGLRA